MALVREGQAEPVVQFTVPYKGTWQSVAANQISADALYSSLNVFIRQGKLRQRPGLALLNASVFNTPVIGGAMAVTPTAKTLLAVTRNDLYSLQAGATVWSVDTTATFAPDDDSIVDIAFLETASTYVALIAEGNNALKAWIEGSGAATIVPTTGTTPTAKSVCTAARRVVALVEPHTVVWSSTLSYTDWPALAFTKVASTNDVGICVVPISALSFALYKERSIHLARAQAGDDSSAFAFSEPIVVEGPAGVHAVVNVNGTHIYMTANGRIALFNAASYPQFIADGLWLYLQSDIDPAYAYKIFGVFDYRLHAVVFYYPRVSDSNGQMTGMVIINAPLEGSGITAFAPFLGISSKPCSYAYEMRFNQQIDRSLFFTSTAGDAQSFQFDETVNADDGDIFNCSIQTGLAPLPVHAQVNVESFFERADGNGHVHLYAVTSDILENATGAVQDASYSTIDLNDNPVAEYEGFDIPTRFFGLQYTWTSDSIVRYAGALVYARSVS